MKPLLTICIPTYNRGYLLRRCLENIVSQDIFVDTDMVQIVISDNCSDDTTQKISLEYKNEFPDKIKYIRQESAISADDNISSVGYYADGVYFKMHNDTLLFKEKSLEQIVEVLQGDENPDVVFFLNEHWKVKSEKFVCKDMNDFLSNVSYFSTWIGAYCFKTEVYKKLENPQRYAYLKLTQVDIIFRLMEKNYKVLIFNKHIFNGLFVDKKGGYNIAEVFGQNYFYILKEYVKKGLISKKVYTKAKMQIVFNYIVKYYFDFNNEYTFHKGKYLYYLRDCWFNLFFYFSYIRVLKLYIIHLIKTLTSKRYRLKRRNGLTIKEKWAKLNENNKIFLGENVTDVKRIYIGKKSYGCIDVLIDNDAQEELIIGNYVSVAPEVMFILASDHPYNGFSTFPHRVMSLGYPFEAISKGDIVVKDDVWIGAKSVILSGLTIGQGAVVAAGSVITKDVPPYAIVGGNPAKIIKYRFKKEIIDKLLKYNFRRLNIDKIKNNESIFYEHLTNENVEEILSKLK